MIGLLNTSLPTVASLNHIKKILRGLGLAEAVLGIISTTIGVMLMVDSKLPRYTQRSSSTYFYLVTFVNAGEGIWCGVWILAAGVLGAICGKKTVTPCLINMHLILSICASSFAAIMMCVSMVYIVLYIREYKFGMGMKIIQTTIGMVAIGLCFSSAKYCDQATAAAGLEGFCGGCFSKETLSQKETAVMPQPQVATVQQVQQPISTV